MKTKRDPRRSSRQGRRHRRLNAALAAGLITGALLLLVPASALAGAGLKPSEAPLVMVGQPYFGDTGHPHNSGSGLSVDLWRLPPLLTSDVITIAWHDSSTWGDRLCLAQDVDDYSWDHQRCNGSSWYNTSGSDAARTTIPVKSSTSAGYLEFSGLAYNSEAYDFTIESIQHALGVSLNRVSYVTLNTGLTGHANLSDGAPVPDGLAFWLNAYWPGHGFAHYEAKSSGGSMRFHLALPRTTIGKTITFVIVRLAGAEYRATKSVPIRAHVNPPKPHRHHRHRHRHHRHRR